MFRRRRWQDRPPQGGSIGNQAVAIVKRRLGSLPPSVFSTLDKNGDGYLTPDEMREGFEVRYTATGVVLAVVYA